MPSKSYPLPASRLTTLLLLVTSIFLLGGCAKTSVIEHNENSNVEVLYSAPEGRDFRKIGLITATTGQTIFHDYSATGIVANMQEKAASLGADAIIIDSVIEGSWGFLGDSTGITKGSGKALAIKYIEHPTSVNQ